MSKPKQSLDEYINARVDRSGECWVWTGARQPLGYGAAHYGGQRWVASRLIWTIAYGPIPPKKEICHKCDNPPCVRLDHLFMGSHKDNMYDAGRKGRNGIKLTPGIAAEIRALYPRLTQREIAKRYGMDHSSVGDILRGLTWSEDDAPVFHTKRRPRIQRPIPKRDKLTKEQVMEIRAKHVPWDRTKSQLALAREYGVSKSAVAHALQGRTWRNVTTEKAAAK